MSKVRRLAFAVLTLGFAATGCFVIFPLDEYEDGQVSVADGAAFDGGDAGVTDARSDAPERPNLDGGRVLFVTKATFTGDLGGIEGADAKCQEAARAAGLAGDFVAFVSLAGSPLQRFGDAKSTTPIIDTTGRTIASRYVTLEKNGPEIEIERDEYGALVRPAADAGSCATNPAVIWTGAGGDWSATGADCAQWRSASDGQPGVVGAGFDRAQWLAACSINCAQKAHLYCAQP